MRFGIVQQFWNAVGDGNSIYQIRTISMGEQDGDQILRELEKRKKKGKKTTIKLDWRDEDVFKI